MYLADHAVAVADAAAPRPELIGLQELKRGFALVKVSAAAILELHAAIAEAVLAEVWCFAQAALAATWC